MDYFFMAVVCFIGAFLGGFLTMGAFIRYSYKSGRDAANDMFGNMGFLEGDDD